MQNELLGIHHITAIAGEPQHNVDFYAGLLGLRLVKLTINFDDPGTYHLYYGDGIGHPGTIMTFFPWPGAPKGRRGRDKSRRPPLPCRPGAIAILGRSTRSRAPGLLTVAHVERFGEQVLAFADPDGLGIELIATGTADAERAYAEGPFPWSCDSWLSQRDVTEGGYQRTAPCSPTRWDSSLVGEEGNRFRYATGPPAPARSRTFFAPRKSGPDGRRRHGASHRLANGGRRAAARVAGGVARATAMTSRRSSTGNTSTRSTIGSPAISCSRSRPIRRASRSMSP